MADPKESERHCSSYEAIHTVASGTRCCDCCPHLNLSRGGSCNPDPLEADLGGKTVLRPERQQGTLIINTYQVTYLFPVSLTSRLVIDPAQ